MSHVGTDLQLGYFPTSQVHDRRHTLQISLSERLTGEIPKEKIPIALFHAETTHQNKHTNNLANARQY